MTSYAGCIVCLTVCLIYMVAVGRSGAKNFFVRHFNDYFLILFCKIILKSWIFSSYCLSVTAGYRINPLPLSLILNAPPGCIPYSVIIWENIESFYRVYLRRAGLFLRKETTWYETKQIAWLIFSIPPLYLTCSFFGLWELIFPRVFDVNNETNSLLECLTRSMTGVEGKPSPQRKVFWQCLLSKKKKRSWENLLHNEVLLWAKINCH